MDIDRVTRTLQERRCRLVQRLEHIERIWRSAQEEGRGDFGDVPDALWHSLSLQGRRGGGGGRRDGSRRNTADARVPHDRNSRV